ncbi:hypothetical protein ABT173_11190 [Streptomyces sp. NPDC001795]|uniref:hypothetical protein n=1 Tax=unclassified Streptomyces TaxID=2593676 RepID=UPI00332AE573
MLNARWEAAREELSRLLVVTRETAAAVPAEISGVEQRLTEPAPQAGGVEVQ